MAVSNKDYGVTGRFPGTVTGKPPGSEFVSDNDRLSGSLKYGIKNEGTNKSSHPAKSQPAKPEYF